MSEEMSSKNSNNSDIEVIGPEDLEDSPPPQDTAEADTGSEEAEAKEASPEVSGAGDQETEAIGEVKETVEQRHCSLLKCTRRCREVLQP